MRKQIIDEIQRLAKANGQTPGSRIFEQQTGIREASWRGVYWARWSDAVKEAGIAPNSKNGRLDEAYFLTKLAEACRHFGKPPTAAEFRLYGRGREDVPNHKSIYRHFGSSQGMFERLAEWASKDPDYADVAAMLDQPQSAEPGKPSRVEGSVYLIRSGLHYKIGRSDELERRVKEIRVTLPESAQLVHSIRTDDPAGIEAYWHRRFADRRANGEWFKLTAMDVAAFKKRKFQ